MMNDIKEMSSFVMIVVEQSLDPYHYYKQFIDWNIDLFTIMKSVPFTSQSKRPIYIVEQRELVDIRRQLNEENYRVIPVYKAPVNIFYVCQQIEIEEKSSLFMQQTQAYSIVDGFKNNDDVNSVQIYIELIYQRMKEQLDLLYKHQYIDSTQYSLLSINSSSVFQLDQLNFVPDLRRYDIPFEPMMTSCSGGSITNIAQYLHSLIAPIYYQQMTSQKLWFQKKDVLDAVQLYHQQGFINSQTIFASIHVGNLCTTFPHSHAIQLLERFLIDYIPNDSSMMIEGLSIQTILQLVHFVLSHQYFIYQNKLYHQNTGGSANTPLTILLANIYMFYWQKELVTLLYGHKEVFGRCLDELFFTWNRSRSELTKLINNLGQQEFISFQLVTSIGTTVNYMDIEISYLHNRIRTKVFHQSLFEPYYLSNIIGHSLYEYRSMLRAVILRAIRYCNNVYDFEQEFKFIQLSFLFNHVSLIDIQRYYHLFEQEFELKTSSYHHCQHDYDELRERIRKYDRYAKNVLIHHNRVGLTNKRTINDNLPSFSFFHGSLKRPNENQYEYIGSCATSKRMKLNIMN